MLSVSPGSEALELFSISPALLVENQGPWADESVRFVHQGDGANVAMTDTGSVFQLFKSESNVEAEARREFQELAALAENEDSVPRAHGPIEMSATESADILDELAGFPDDLLSPENHETEVLEFSAGFGGGHNAALLGVDQGKSTPTSVASGQCDWPADGLDPNDGSGNDELVMEMNGAAVLADASMTWTKTGQMVDLWDTNYHEFVDSEDYADGIQLGAFLLFPFPNQQRSKPTYSFALPNPAIGDAAYLSGIEVRITGHSNEAAGSGVTAKIGGAAGYTYELPGDETTQTNRYDFTGGLGTDWSPLLREENGAWYLDVTLAAIADDDWYDLKDVAITYTYHGISNDDLARMDQIVRGVAQLERYQRFHTSYLVSGNLALREAYNAFLATSAMSIMKSGLGPVGGFGTLWKALESDSYDRYVQPYFDAITGWADLTSTLSIGEWFNVDVQTNLRSKVNTVTNHIDNTIDDLESLVGTYYAALRDGAVDIGEVSGINAALDTADGQIDELHLAANYLALGLVLSYEGTPAAYQEDVGKAIEGYLTVERPLYAYDYTLGSSCVSNDAGSYFVAYQDLLQRQRYAVDTNPPTPNPSTWAAVPYATSSTSIGMQATTANDPSGVEYFFDCTTSGGHDSGWQSSPVYEDTGLSPNVSYTYKVKTRDLSSNYNEGSYSSPSSATTAVWHHLGQSLVAQDMQGSSPWDPINPTTTFYQTDERVTWWAEFVAVDHAYTFINRWYRPDGELYSDWNSTIPDPAHSGHDCWSTYRWGSYADVAGYQMQNYCGQWKIEVSAVNPDSGQEEVFDTKSFQLFENPARKPSIGVSHDDDSIDFTAADNTHVKQVTINWNDGTDKSQTWDNLYRSSVSQSISLDTSYLGTISYTITAVDTSGNIETTSGSFTINHAPTDIVLSGSSIEENQSFGTQVGTLSTVDPDAGNTFSYSLVPGTGSTDNSLFSLSGPSLQGAAIFDYETRDSYSIRVRSTDQGGRSVEKPFNIEITDVNDPPIARAGGPYVAQEFTSVTLNAAASCDSDGTIVSYLWDFDEDGQFNDADGIEASYAIPGGGTHTVRLKVIDSEGVSAESQAIVRAQGPRAMAYSPSGTVDGVVDSVEIVFDEPIDSDAIGRSGIGWIDLDNMQFTSVGQVAGSFHDCVVVNDYAYATTDAGLRILDISTPSAPVLVSSYDTPSVAGDIEVVDSLAYVATGLSGLYLIDVSTPSTPSLVGSYVTLGEAKDVEVIGSLACVADDAAGLQVFDVSVPSTTVLGRSRGIATSEERVDMINSYACAANHRASPGVIDFEDLSLLSEDAYSGVDSTFNNFDGESSTFSSKGTVFNNYHQWEQWGRSWHGWAFSNMSHNPMNYVPGDYNPGDGSNGNPNPVPVGLAGQFHAVAGSGAGGSANYGMAYSGWLETPPTISLPAGGQLKGAYFTNTNYAYYAMLEGDLFAKKFSSDDEDWFLVTVTGKDAAGSQLDSVSVYLADLRPADQRPDNDRKDSYILKEWTWFDLSSLSTAATLEFEITSSDSSEWFGPNTPTYVAVDNVVFTPNPLAPVLVGSCDTPGLAEDVEVIDSLAYVADNDSGLQVIDLSMPSDPVTVGSYDTPGRARDVEVIGSLAYVADHSGGLQVIDVSTPSAPVLVSSYGNDSLTQACAVEVIGSLAYVIDQQSGLHVIDVSMPSTPISIGSYDTAGLAKNVEVIGSLAYVANDDGGLTIVESGASAASVSALGSETYRIDFGTILTEGRYSLVLGPNIADLAGNPLDQNLDGIGGTSNDVYSASWEVLPTPDDVTIDSGDTLSVGLSGSAPVADINNDVLVAHDVTLTGSPALRLEWLPGEAGDGLFGGIYTIATYSGTLTGTFAAPTLSASYNGADASAYIDLRYGTDGIDYGSGTNDAITVKLKDLILGDANLDGDVDVWQWDGKGDAQLLSNNLGTTTGMTWSDGDFNFDGDVDVWQWDGNGDAQLLSSNLGTGLDIALKQAVIEEPDRIEPLSAPLDWQYEFKSTQSKTAKRKDVEATVDLLLATDWQ